MGFERVRFYQFRNIADGIVDFAAPDVFLVGRNGQGKSNILEALYLISYGGSFRTRRDQELCRRGTHELALDGRISTESGPLQVEIRYRDQRKTIHLDGSVLADRRDLVSRIPVVVFRHDDMGFVNGPPDMQRWFTDQTLSMNDPVYIDQMRRYRKILRNRNQLIRDGREDLLPVYDRQLAEAGLEIQRRREEALGAFSDVFADEYHRMADLEDELNLEYRPSWRSCRSIADVVAYLEAHRSQEQALRTTTSGPHRDRVVFRLGGDNFLTLASTGQIRLVALILRVAQARFFSLRTGRLPILLLDDVLLELDHERRERFLHRLPPSDQRVFTFLPGEPYQGYRNDHTLVYSVEDGTVRRE